MQKKEQENNVLTRAVCNLIALKVLSYTTYLDWFLMPAEKFL